ncbi:hypothetical protein [Xenorhabdus anantnagensis]|uniref:Uncharacterized protein n=1 Tax=Xenorhabdus anantnagensis TaxID=3025875 RepID=A0ABT5LRA1_9GAMM|nr:hypothetical protein [Xenorhabdus anantnagensis]MDC9596952.1 hypothetical protein [Xenorhabdus anantnagensis]
MIVISWMGSLVKTVKTGYLIAIAKMEAMVGMGYIQGNQVGMAVTVHLVGMAGMAGMAATVHLVVVMAMLMIVISWMESLVKTVKTGYLIAIAKMEAMVGMGYIQGNQVGMVVTVHLVAVMAMLMVAMVAEGQMDYE